MLGIDEEGQTLKEFIDQHHNLLSAMAVLIAIASFGATLSVHWIGSIILFLSIAGTMTVWIELYKSFPKKGTLRLIIFKNILSFGLLTFGFYWLLAFSSFWNLFSFIPLFIFLYYLLLTNLKQVMSFSFVRKLFGEKGHRTIYQKGLLILYGFVIFYSLSWLMYLSVGAAPALNFILELIRVNFH